MLPGTRGSCLFPYTPLFRSLLNREAPRPRSPGQADVAVGVGRLVEALAGVVLGRHLDSCQEGTGRAAIMHVVRGCHRMGRDEERMQRDVGGSGVSARVRLVV